MTTCSAARTISPPTGRPSRRRSRSSRRWPSPRGRTGRSSAASIRYLAGEAGMRQFLDIGTGIPTAGNTHQVAQAIAPESRVVYVDYDPVVLAHARALLVSNEAGATEYIDADLRDTRAILAQAGQVAGLQPARWRSRCSRSCTRYRTPTTRTRSWPRLMDAVPSGQLPRRVPHGRRTSSPSRRKTGNEGHREPHDASSSSPTARASRWPGSSRARTWWSPGLCGSRNGARIPGPADAGKSSLWCAVGRKR